MDTEAQFRALMDLAEVLGFEIRSAPSVETQRAGALVKIHHKEVIFLDFSAPLIDRIAFLAEILRGRDELQQMYIVPELRRLIETGQL